MDSKGGHPAAFFMRARQTAVNSPQRSRHAC